MCISFTITCLLEQPQRIKTLGSKCIKTAKSRASQIRCIGKCLCPSQFHGWQKNAVKVNQSSLYKCTLRCVKVSFSSHGHWPCSQETRKLNKILNINRVRYCMWSNNVLLFFKRKQINLETQCGFSLLPGGTVQTQERDRASLQEDFSFRIPTYQAVNSELTNVPRIFSNRREIQNWRRWFLN